MLPAVAVTVPDIETAEAVICPDDFNTKAPFELLIVVVRPTPLPLSSLVTKIREKVLDCAFQIRESGCGFPEWSDEMRVL